MLKQEIGNLAFFGEDFGGSGLLKKELHAWPLRAMWCEEIFLWIGPWMRPWWSSFRYPLSIAESASWKEIFLIADLRKFYQVSNSIAESPIRKKIFIIAKWRQFFQVFYRGIVMLRTQKLWMLNTRLDGFFPFKTLHKGTFWETNYWNLTNTFFLNNNYCCCCSIEDSTVEKISIF